MHFTNSARGQPAARQSACDQAIQQGVQQFAGLLFGGLIYGGQSVQLAVGAPTDIINIMIGTIVFFVALARVVTLLADKLGKRGANHA